MGNFARATVITIAVSCSVPAEHTGKVVDLGSEPPSSGDRPFEGVAHAAPATTLSDASIKDAATPTMPENPSHISLRLPKVPQVLVTQLGGAAYPYPYTLTEMADCMILTLYLQQGERVELEMKAMAADGKPLSDSVRFTVEPIAKLGTNELSSATEGPLIFSNKYERPVAWGETFLQGPTSNEFIDGDGTEHEVMQGIFAPEADTLCEVSWVGCGTVYSFLDDTPVPRTEPFVISVKAGQKLGLYPVVNQNVEVVRFNLHEPTCAPSEE